MVDAVLDVVGNTLPSVMLGNVELSCKRQLSWFDFDEEIISYLADKEVESKTKFQGMASIYEYLEKNPKVSEVLEQFVKEKILSE